MRPVLRALIAAVALSLALPAAAAEAAFAQAPASAAPSLPSKPIPYTKLRPQKRKVAKPPAAAQRTPTAAVAATGVATMAAANTAMASNPASATFTPLPVVAPPPVAAALLPVAAPALPLNPIEAERFVDGVVRAAMARDHIAGVTVAIVQNGHVVVQKGYGFASLSPRRPVDPERTLFRLGAVSRTFTWVALMQEVEAGRVRLDRPANLYLPERLAIRDQGHAQPVRVANLMDHSAGFENRALGHLYEHDYRRVRPLEAYLRQERPRRVHAPGAVSSYSDWGAGVAGEMLEYVSGRPFEALIEDRILAPSGLSRTTFREPHAPRAGMPAPMNAALAGDLATGYAWTAAGFVPQPFEYMGQIAPAGAASSTAADMSRYMLLILNGGAAPNTNAAPIWGPRAATGFRTPMRKVPDGINGWAHGFKVYDLPGGRRGFGHDGQTPSFNANLVTIPSLGLGVFIATNSSEGERLSAALPATLVAQFYAPAASYPAPASPELAARAGVFSGYYLSTRRAYSGLEGFVSTLGAGARVEVTPTGGLVVEANEPKAYAPVGPVTNGVFTLAANNSETLAFQIQEGKARAFMDSAGAEVFQRAPFWRLPIVLLALATATAFAAVATLAGILRRSRREARQNLSQAQVGIVQNIQAVLWLTSLGLFSGWALRTKTQAAMMFDWPGAPLIIASACALVAAILTLVTLASLPAIWRGGRRVESWTPWRKLAFTVTVLIYGAFSALLLFSGALSPWSG